MVIYTHVSNLKEFTIKVNMSGYVRSTDWMHDERYLLDYDTWLELKKTVEESDVVDLITKIAPFLAGLGPFAPEVAAALAAALAIGGKAAVLELVEKIPHLYPAHTGMPGISEDALRYIASPKIHLGKPLSLFLPTLSNRPSTLASFNRFIQPLGTLKESVRTGGHTQFGDISALGDIPPQNDLKPVISSQFRPRKIEQPRAQALIYKKQSTYLHHPQRIDRPYNDVGPNASVNRVGF